MHHENEPVSKEQVMEMLERRGIIKFLSSALQIEVTRLLDLDLQDGVLKLFLETENGSQIVVKILFDTQAMLDLFDTLESLFPSEEEPEEEEKVTLLDVEPE